MLVLALATARRSCPELMDAVAASCRSLEWGTQDVSSLALAYAMCGRAAPALFDALLTPRRATNSTAAGLVQLLWACAILDYAAPSCAFSEALAEALPLRWKEIESRDDSQAKLHAVLLWLRFEQPAQTTLLRLLSGKEDALKEAAARVRGGPSRSQAQLSDALTALGWVHEREHFSSDGLHVGVASLEAKTTFLFDGPFHYFTGPGGPVLDGRATFKRRLLATLGWTGLGVPCFAWDALATKDAQKTYLQNKLTR